jgi:ABC-2 type transport system permease protein
VTRSFASEWVKLRRRGMLYAAALVAAVTTLVTGVSIATASEGRGHGLRPEASLTLDTLAASEGFAQALGTASTIIGAVLLSVFAFAVASEFSHGTLRNLLVREPRRVRLIAGKLLALASFAAIVVTAASIVAVPAAIVSAAAVDIESSAWLSAEGVSDSAAAVALLLGATLGWGLLGAFLGLLLRSPTTAIAAGLAYALPVENLLNAAWDDVAGWLPGQLLNALAAGGNDEASLGRAALLLTAYATAALAVTTVSFSRRDVTA